MAAIVNIVNAFVDGGRGGNPAGVVLDADGLSAQQKQAIARLAGLSETAFVSSSNVAGFKLEFFTPSRQIAHCGHATIATFALLSQRGLVSGPESSKETIDGKRRIVLRGEQAFMEQRAPTYVDEADFPPAVTGARILASLGLGPADVLASPCVVGTGNRFVLVHARSSAVLATLAPDMGEIALVSESFGAVGYYVFATDDPEFAATARMFGPAYGIEEEAATGMAAGPLACYLYDRVGVRETSMQIRQGAFMREPSPSRIAVELRLEEGRIAGLYAGGSARVVSALNVVV